MWWFFFFNWISRRQTHKTPIEATAEPSRTRVASHQCRCLDRERAQEHFAHSGQRNCDRHDAAYAMFDSWFTMLILRKREDDSGWPHIWESENNILLLRHARQDHRQGITALTCHMDVSMSDGTVMLSRYWADYVPKFSSEMWHQLCAKDLIQCKQEGTMVTFVVPVPWRDRMPDRVLQ